MILYPSNRPWISLEKFMICFSCLYPLKLTRIYSRNSEHYQSSELPRMQWSCKFIWGDHQFCTRKVFRAPGPITLIRKSCCLPKHRFLYWLVAIQESKLLIFWPEIFFILIPLIVCYVWTAHWKIGCIYSLNVHSVRVSRGVLVLNGILITTYSLPSGFIKSRHHFLALTIVEGRKVYYPLCI